MNTQQITQQQIMNKMGYTQEHLRVAAWMEANWNSIDSIIQVGVTGGIVSVWISAYFDNPNLDSYATEETEILSLRTWKDFFEDVSWFGDLELIWDQESLDEWGEFILEEGGE